MDSRVDENPGQHLCGQPDVGSARGHGMGRSGGVLRSRGTTWTRRQRMLEGGRGIGETYRRFAPHLDQVKRSRVCDTRRRRPHRREGLWVGSV